MVTDGAGQNPARIAAIEAGIPISVPAITINKVCLSGIDAIILADQSSAPATTTSWWPAAWNP